MTLTFITPISPEHQQYLPACIASVQSQTIPCQHLMMLDEERLGPGVIRNRLLSRVTTSYVSFLDADDWLEPDYAQHMLEAATRASYAYSDWYLDDRVFEAPARAWCNGTFHLVTAVVPRELAVHVGGFDETLTAMEDTDFFLKFITREWCGVRVPKPLVHYRANGGRGDAVRQSGLVQSIRAELTRRYGGRPLGCCGNPIQVDDTPIGTKQDGDVLAMALWGGNRPEYGRQTGRRYPRMSYPHTTWVDPRDVQASPQLWKIVAPDEVAPPNPFDLSPTPALVVKGIGALRLQLVKHGGIIEAPPTPTRRPVASIPNFMKVKRLAGAVKLPVFVASRASYPSYADFWRLVDLSGFEIGYADEIDLANGDQTYIFCGPDGIPNCSNAKARTIFWQLEYVGDYTNQPNHQTVGEIWSSDPEHAAAHNYCYVLLGSHQGLNPDLAWDDKPEYDLTMLAYLTARRQAIKEQLSEWRWAPDYPGHDTAMRHHILKSARLMLHVHQHDAPAATPLRYALAAAYKLPVISERIVNSKPYAKTITWAAYEQLAAKVKDALNKDLADKGDALHNLLCIERPFYQCVMEALA